MPEPTHTPPASRPIRVAHVITELDVGGAEVTLARLAGAMDPQLVGSAVISLAGRGALASEIERSGVPVYTLQMQRGRPGLGKVLQLIRLMRELQPDIVQTWLYHADLLGLLAARAAGVPLAFWNIRCSELDDASTRPSLRMIRRVLAWLSSVPTAVITNSVEGRRTHERLGYRPRAWHVIPNGIDTARFKYDARSRARVREELGIPETAAVVGIIGRYHPMKDHASFMAAAARVAQERPGSVFILVGRGLSEVPELTALARKVDGRVLLTGERRDIEATISALDVLVSSSFSEGFPNTLLEGMATERPVVATDVGDSARIVGAHGIVVPPRDPAALAHGILTLLRMAPDVRAGIGARGRQWVIDQYSLSAAAERYTRLYLDAARRRWA